MVMTAGGHSPFGGAAVAAGTGTSSLETAHDKEAKARVLSSLGLEEGAAGPSIPEKSQRTLSAESLDAAPLPVFRQSVSSTLTGPGSGSFFINGNGSCNNSLLEGANGVSTKDKGQAGRGAISVAGGGMAAAARKGEKGKAVKNREGGEAAYAAGGGRAPMSQAHNTRTRSSGAATTPVGITPYEGAERTDAARGGGSSGGAVDDSGALAEAEDTVGTPAAAAGRGGWTALFHGTSREGRTGQTPERSLLINNAGGTGRPAARHHEGRARTAAVATIPEGETSGESAAPGGAEQQGLLQRKAEVEKKARQWMIAGLIAYFFLGLLVLYCVSYANVEWCCIFIIFGAMVGGMGLVGLRHSNRLLLLIHVATAAALLFSLFVAWCYNMHVLLRAIEVLLASSWPPLHHDQFKYYYSIPTAYEAAPAPWLEEVILMRFHYPSGDDPGIRKMISTQPPAGTAHTSKKRRGKKKAPTAGTTSKNGHAGGEKSPTTGVTSDNSQKVTNADREGETDTTKGTEAGERPGGDAVGVEAKEQEGRKDTTAATAEQRSGTHGRRLESAEEAMNAAAAAAERKKQAAFVTGDWRQEIPYRNNAEMGKFTLGWRRRLARTDQTRRRGYTWPQFGKGRERSKGERNSTSALLQEGGMQNVTWGIPPTTIQAVGGENGRNLFSTGLPLEKQTAAAAAEGRVVKDTALYRGAHAVDGVSAAAARTGKGRRMEDRHYIAYSATAGEKKTKQTRSRGVNRRLQARPASDTATPRNPAVASRPRGSPGGREPRRGTRSLPANPEKNERAGKSEKTEENTNGNIEESEEKNVASLGERATADKSSETLFAGSNAAAGSPSASAPVTAGTGAAAASDPVSPPASANASSTGQQLRGSGSAQQQQQGKEDGHEGQGKPEKEGLHKADDGGPRGSESPAASSSLTSVLWLAAEQTGGPTPQQPLQQRIIMDRDATARGLIKGCVEGAERNENFLDEAAHAMSSLATRGWLCAFARAEIVPFHHWPVDCSTECGYGFLDTGHDLQPSDYYDMTRVAEYLIQISSLPPKRMQQCVDYAASTICSIKNRNFFAVWVALLLIWLLVACAACCGIVPVSLYNTVQVIKGMQQP